ncbi:hypothetical protein [Nonomuraea gerenzanensis]|uniref:Uncharacterized protein n=1 Tax=Nonomuraea gerenzanensis TaxID=93944 RepID=A0A1M4EQ20_9ACTN|nr:hypothetical protein [Nonomuraea gerenzanensis]UBU12379.1 hypothetical protein LCN96_50260 [Nonomuraea gerenzanensis]SBP00928.1 hypothetical protein BN4615_P10444 [Nonomuraea gerenzanensis]
MEQRGAGERAVPLAGAVGGACGAWLPLIGVTPVHDARQAARRGCPGDGAPCWCTVDLVDVQVLGMLPSAGAPGLVDIDLQGFARVGSEAGGGVEEGRRGFRLSGMDDEWLGSCREAGGVLRERAEPLRPPATLVGCLPEPALIAAVEATSVRRRAVRATVYALGGAGERLVGSLSSVSGKVTGARPSRLGEGLLDIALDEGVFRPMPSGAREI